MFEFYLPLIAILLSLSLVIYLLLRQRSGLAILALAGALLACACSELFDLLAVTHPEDLIIFKRGAIVAESWQPIGFLLFALSFGRDRAFQRLSWPSRLLLALSLAFPVFALVAPASRFFYSPDFAEEKILFLGNLGFVFYIALMGYLVSALFHLERTLVALPRAERVQIKLEVVGVGTILAMLVVYYSQALLYRTIDMNLFPVRSLLLSIGVVMIGWSRLRGGIVGGVRVSRDMASRSLVLLAVSIYLVGLALVGEGMNYMDGAMQRALFVSIAVLLGLAVVLVILSEKLRGKVKVFLHKHFYRQKYDYRKEWRRFTRHLSSARTVEKLQEGILSFYSETFAYGAAALYLRDDEVGCYRFVAGHQISPLFRQFEKNSSFIAFLAGRDWIFNVADNNPPDIADALDFCRENEFNLAVPLLFEKSLEGIIFLGRTLHPWERLSYEDFDLMKMLAWQATSTLLSLKLSAQLSTAREMAAIGKVSAFVVHDLKNLASNLSMVADNAREYLDDPEFQQDMIETLEGTTSRMKALIARLKNVTEQKALNLVEADLLQIAIEGVRLAGGEQVTVSGEPVSVLLDLREIEKVVHNLVLNGIEAGGAPIKVEVGRDETAWLRVSDHGSGMTEEFIRQRLFQPFQTTKPKGFGIGLYQCRNIVEAHGGRIEVESRVGEGTTFTVWFDKVVRREG
ncbi:MAG: PEP-CTERM system histidine kinase PrsK [Syntrophotaleaceae bacterium]